ncbi:MAG TPA: GNAT family N-acetyltransferase [Flavipsychrobacter sp.]|nr:GNAT family N-acetyltransferase [Flavipsychrobacter sp.]
MRYVRTVVLSDIEGLKTVVESCELFPSELLDEMMEEYFRNAQTPDIWFTCIDQNKPIAIGYCVPEKLTQGTYNLLAIGVALTFQRMGIATEMMQYWEQLLKQKNARILIVETSGDPAQMAARNFYKKIGYIQEATIKDFWNDGEDKIIFLKKL